MNPHQSFLGRLLAIACLLALFLVPFQAASADPEVVGLVRFEATAGPSGIGVVWETTTEFDTIGFRLYRSLDASPDDWGAPLYDVAAHGDIFSGWTYSYTDTAVVLGTTYYYLLEEIEVGGGATVLGLVSAVAGFSCGAVTEIPPEECEALVALYESTSGPTWTHRDSWLTTNTPCSWHGVTCVAGRVQGLALNGNQLSGSIPPELGKLANLRVFYLGNNQLIGSIPPELGKLANLQHLDLQRNQLSGSVPPWLGNLANLWRLELGGNQLDGGIPPELGNLANLGVLDLGNNQLIGSIPPELGKLANLANLQYLDLSRNQLIGGIPPELGKLANLRVLYLGNNHLGGSIPPELGNLANLQYLDLSRNQLSGSIPPQLGNLAILRYLLLNINQLSGPLPRSLMKLSLDRLWFDTTNVCEPPDPNFQAWLHSIPSLLGTEVLCKLSHMPLVFRQTSSTASFWADRYRLEPGECTGLHWQVANARQVFLDDLEVSPQGTLQVCPSATTTYLLTVVQTNGIRDYHRLAIYVGGDQAWFGVDEDGNFYRGNPKAMVKLEEFMDFQCPYCVRHALQTGPLLDEAYIATGEVVEVFRNFPLDFHSGAVPAAKAAYCAGQQKPEFFWSMYDWLVQNQEAWNQDSEPSAQFRAAALRLGADILRYDACLAHVATEAHIQRDVQEGSDRGVRGVPAFFINSCSLSGALPFENFRDTIEKAKQGLCTPGVQFFDIDPARPGFTTDGSPTRGAVNAPVILISYEDFKNIGSAQHALAIGPALLSEYVDAGQVRLVYEFFAGTAPRAAVAALCAARQGEFWEFRSLLYEERENWTEYSDHDDPIMLDYASRLGLDSAAFDACLIDPTARSQVDASYAFARDQIGVPVPPSFLLIKLNYAGVIEAAKGLPGPQTLEALEQAIQEMLSSSAASVQAGPARTAKSEVVWRDIWSLPPKDP